MGPYRWLLKGWMLVLCQGCYVQADGFSWDAQQDQPEASVGGVRAEVEVDRSARWTLTWSDEFDAASGSPPDPGKWTHDVGGHGWGNAELQYHTDRADNAAHDGQGNLRIIARREPYRTNAYTSARLTTLGLFSQRYGRFEARLKLPAGQGIWPAFWLLGESFPNIGWPACGEIDIMEARGQHEEIVHGSLHGPGYSGGAAISRSFEGSFDTNFTTDFHTFTVTWDPERIAFSVNDDVYHVVTPSSLTQGPWVFDGAFFIILNVAVGGHYPGDPDATTPFPAEMLVDYVRVWERDP